MRRLESASPAYTIAANRFDSAWETLVIMHHAFDKVGELDNAGADHAAFGLWAAAVTEYQSAAHAYRIAAHEERQAALEKR
jgi:hypothetical protein